MFILSFLVKSSKEEMVRILIKTEVYFLSLQNMMNR